MLAFESINPATEEQISVQKENTYEETLQSLNNGHRAFQEWRKTALSVRVSFILNIAEILRKRKVEFGALMAREMGKPVLQGIGEAEKCAWLCQYYAQQAKKLLSPEIIETDAAKSYVAHEPIGIILGIMPWNFPFWQVFRFIVPSLLAGNAAILKHAPNVSECAKAIKSITEGAGLPDSVFQVIYVQPEIIAKLIEHPFIQGVTLTGSTRAGQSVASTAGRFMKKTVMELGGSDPYIILEDADLERAAEACVTSRLINTGQSCISAKRFIVVESARKAFEKLVGEKMQTKKTGDPMDPTVEIGPLARKDLRDNLHRQVTESVSQGAQILLGGTVPDRKGFYYSPTVLTGIRKGMTVYDEETFGPVAAIITVKDEQEAIRTANDTIYGLGAAVFTKDVRRGERIAAKELFAGSCFVNTFVKSDPRLPFGGIKESGYGRELSPFGIREFVNIKTVYVK